MVGWFASETVAFETQWTWYTRDFPWVARMAGTVGYEPVSNEDWSQRTMNNAL